MRMHLTRAWIVWIRHRASRVLLSVVVAGLLLTIDVPAGSEPTPPEGTATAMPVTERSPAVQEAGPTIRLSYNRDTFKDNPISSFMYFIPLISLTLVGRETSAGNTEQVGGISYERKTTAKSFSATCDFEILGTGFHKNAFDPEGMIAAHIGELGNNETLPTSLDYIKFDGAGYGRIEVKGTISDSMETVTEVNIQFNRKGQKSPVTIGLYDVAPKDGQYKFENRSNEIVARVNTLRFKRGGTPPRMDVSVASITKAHKSEGFLASVKGVIANLFIKPVKITELGNDTMLRFGQAIFQQQPDFTFPKANNIKEDKLVATASPGTGKE